jgi:DNA-binding response OmpR family regulator
VLDVLRQDRALSVGAVLLTATAGLDTDVPGSADVSILSKPFAPSVLLERVRAAVARNGRAKRFDFDRTAGSEQFVVW